MHEVAGDFKAYKQLKIREASGGDHRRLSHLKSCRPTLGRRPLFVRQLTCKASATASPLASELVRPGLSMPNKAIRPSMP